MRIDTPVPQPAPRSSAVHVAIELSSRGEEMLSILNDIFKDGKPNSESRSGSQATETASSR